MQYHTPVMANDVINALAVRKDGVYIDATTGGGGHSELIALQLGKNGTLVCIDQDIDAINYAKSRLAAFAMDADKPRIYFMQANFEDLEKILSELSIEAANGVLFDLGVSSYQLDTPERGFSYMHDARPDMRMSDKNTVTAEHIVNTYGQDELEKIFREYGEERYARRIAAALIREREIEAITATHRLSEIIRSAMPPAARKEPQHPAKRVFQALRIAVNRELEVLPPAISAGINVLAPCGRIAVISFHSLEDRIVKQELRKRVQGCVCPRALPECVCGFKPTLRDVKRHKPTSAEVEQNPRSRSAILRTAVKL